jgi:hypothetical protein
MANNTQSNNNYRPATKVRKPVIVHKPFETKAGGSITYVRNPEAGNGGADLLSSNSEAIVIPVTSDDALTDLETRTKRNYLVDRTLIKYEEVLNEYKKLTLVPGQAWFKQTNDGKYIVLVCTKNTLKDVPQSGHIAWALDKIGEAIKDGKLPVKSIAFARIGCGTGNLAWNEVGRAFGISLANYNVQCGVYGIRWDEPIFIADSTGVTEWTRDDCIERDRLITMEIRKTQKHTAKGITLQAPASLIKEEKPKKTRVANKSKKAATVSSEAKEEPCGMFKDIPEADQALVVVLD